MSAALEVSRFAESQQGMSRIACRKFGHFGDLKDLSSFDLVLSTVKCCKSLLIGGLEHILFFHRLGIVIQID